MLVDYLKSKGPNEIFAFWVGGLLTEDIDERLKKFSKTYERILKVKEETKIE